MIDTIEIRNFRCFKHLKPLPLKRFNVVVGESGSGKTSLIEAIFLHGGGSPEIYFRLRNWRGFARNPTIVATKEAWELIFRDMFYDFDLSQIPRITSISSSSGRRELEVYFKDQDSYSLNLSGNDQNNFVLRPIVFKWVVNSMTYESSIDREDGNFKVKGMAPVSPVAYFNGLNVSMPEATAAFSSLSRHFEDHILKDEIHKSFPFVKDVNIEIVAGEAVIHISSGLPERLPLADASGGLNKFIAIALGIFSNPGGTVLVDEIESGFYYKHVAAIWGSLMRLCELKQSQLIVTTHSYEFLKSITGPLEDDSHLKQFQLLRMSKEQGEEPIIKRVRGDEYLSAIENEFEIR